MDKPKHVSLPARRVLAGIKSRRRMRPGGVREETPLRGNVTAHAEFSHGTTAFDGSTMKNRVGPQAVSLVSQTPVRACKGPPTRPNNSGRADALGAGVAPVSNGSTVTAAETRPERGKINSQGKPHDLRSSR